MERGRPFGRPLRLRSVSGQQVEAEINRQLSSQAERGIFGCDGGGV
jgi:hypothetical protein